MRRAARAFVALLAVVTACRPGAPPRDWSEIQARDTLVVLTAFNSTSYFVYRGEALGLEYEFLRDFAAEHDLVFRTEVRRTAQDAFDDLARGIGDVVAARIIPTAALARRMAFTDPLYTTRPALVQRSAPPAEGLHEVPATILDWPEDAQVLVRARLIASPAELGDETVHVPARSPYRGVLLELSDAVTGDITVVEAQGDSATESLVRGVSRGDIELAVTQENLALLKQGYFENIEVGPVVGPVHAIALGVNRGAPRLMEVLNEWIAAKAADGTLERLHRKYFIDRRGYLARVDSEYLTSVTGRLSAYDSLFRQHAARIGWDWRLLASQAYQESRFDPRARSWAGAQGLLQLMPGTARDLRVRDVWDPHQNVDGAVRFIEQLDTRWRQEIADSTERLKFVLASYNTGPGHVYDAQRLTDKYGGNRLIWDDVAYWLLQKSKRPIYTDPVVRYGYSRGMEPVLYVQKILDRFDHYLQFVADVPAAGG
jgi:membrane-bound lytic murein transglycosylase F